MEISRGDRCTITAEGETATKHYPDGKVRTMRYYPERDAEAIAGEIDELTAWRLLRDIAMQAPGIKTPIMPSHILIDGEGFRIAEWSESRDYRFEAPEGYSPVWALGASVFYIFMGSHVFHGTGGKGQHASTPVPSMRRGLTALNAVTAGCLSFHPGTRPSLEEIALTAESNMERLKGSRHQERKKKREHYMDTAELDRLWPEEMI